MTKKKLIYNVGIMLADFIAYFVICLFSSLLFKGNIAYNFVMSALVLSALKVIISFILKNYNLLWMYSIRHNLVRFGIVVYALDLIVLILSQLPDISNFTGFSFRIYTIVMITEFAYMGTSRYLISYVLNKYYHKKKKADKINRTLIIGAGNAGVMVRNELCTLELGNKVVAFLDDSKDKIGTYINGVKVYGPIDKVNEVVDSLDIEKIIIALPSAGITRIKEITNLIDYKNEEVLILPDKTKLLQSDISTNIRKVEIADLLGRKTIDVVDENTANFYKDKVVLITGGGGSIGSELCRQVAKMNPKQIIVLDIYENCAYDIQQELKFKYGNNLDLKIEIISITNKPALERVFEKYKPNIVVMAAAHKHVPLMENNVVEAVENNVFGTLNTVELAEKYGVDRVHMVSTDKAVNPTSVMGATKRICEMIVQAHSSIEQHTTFSITRFGNVLGSAGSVIPLFKRQIEAGGPVTLTDYRIIRYFMTIPEASQLVLQSASMAKNGELFVLDMGEPVKIYDLAKNLIRLSGFEPDVDIKIIETGLRPGEKLYEELLVKTEELDKTDNELIFIERDKPLELEKVNEMLELLQKAVNKGNDENMKNIIKKVVPTFIEKEEANKVIKNGDKVLVAAR
ncbi:MAG: polysaccharide biosynthesis protein [Anaeroplasma sp.]|nr:polysaccharide biosynthesis protein [Anaeroplasma sp.]